MSRIIGIVSGKGGVGKTTVASNLSYALSELGQKVITIDCNITTPHLSNYVPDFSWRATLNDVINGKTDISSALHYNNGIYIVPASPNLADLVDVNVSNLRKVVQQLTSLSSVIILDSAPGLGKEAVSVLNSCNELLFVTIPQRAAVNDITRCMVVAKEIGVKTTGLILNMYKKKQYNLTPKEIEEITGLNVIDSIEFDEKVANSVYAKLPLVKFWPEEKVSHQFMKIAADLIGVPYKPRRDFVHMFARLFKQKPKPKATNHIFTYTVGDGIKTAGDRILDLLTIHKNLQISEIEQQINLSADEIYKWGKILEEQKLLNLQPSIFGINKTKLSFNG